MIRRVTSLPPFVDDRPRDHAVPEGLSATASTSPTSAPASAAGSASRTPTRCRRASRRRSRELVGEEVAVVGASRTDAGVHARAQVAHVDLGRPFSSRGLVHGTNHLLPPAIRVLAAGLAPRGLPRPLLGRRQGVRLPHPAGALRASRPRPFVLAVPDRLDLERLAGGDPAPPRQARLLLLRPRRRQPPLAGPHPVPRRVGAGGRARSRCAIAGDGFLRGMVRGLVGTLLEVALGQRSPAELRGAARGRRARRGRTDRPGARALSRAHRLRSRLVTAGRGSGAPVRRTLW